MWKGNQFCNKKFDIVFTSLGVLCWLHDLPAWAKVVSHFVNVGGTFVLVEEHPLAFILEEKSAPDNLHMRIQSFREYPFGMFQRFGWMVKNENGWWQSPDGKMKVPMLFSLQCSKLY
jgi:hypothetical protein